MLSRIKELEKEINSAEEYIKKKESKCKEDTEKYMENLGRLNDWEKKYKILSEQFKKIKIQGTAKNLEMIKEVEAYKSQCKIYANRIEELKSKLTKPFEYDMEKYKEEINEEYETKIKGVLAQNGFLTTQINHLQEKVDNLMKRNNTSQRPRYKFSEHVFCVINYRN